MKSKAQLRLVERLEGRCERMRRAMGVSRRGETLYQAPLSMWSERDVVVEADGKGGATLRIVVGNYPNDYWIKSEQRFRSEHAACEAAEELLARGTGLPASTR